RNGRFADEVFAFEKIGALLGETDHDFRRAGNSLAVPVTGRRRWSDGCGGRRGRSFDFGAANDQREEAQGKRAAKKVYTGHKDADSSAACPMFNPKPVVE